MPRIPKEGDFVLWLDQTWVIEHIRGRSVKIISGDDEERLDIETLSPTDIKTWEAE